MWLSFLFFVFAGQESPGPHREAQAPSDRLQVHIEALSDDELEGRNAGTDGAKRAAQYIIERFREYGLLPGPDGTYVQRFSFSAFSLDDRSSLQPAQKEGFNLLGLVEGSTRREEVVMVVTHYDHLGKEGQMNPGRRKEARGDGIWNGANDNASGVAAFLSLAEAVSSGDPERTFFFVAFSAQEYSQRGSLWYAGHPIIPFDQVSFVLALDRVGRFGSSAPLEVHGVGSGRGMGPVVQKSLSREALKAELYSHAGLKNVYGDHSPFFRAGIPTLLLTAQPHGSDRTSRDHAKAVDIPALKKVMRAAYGILSQVDQLDSPPEFVEARSFGFLQGGVGSSALIQAAGLSKGSGAIFVLKVDPDTVAARAGLQRGDWLISLNGVSFPARAEVKTFRRVLDRLSAGTEVPVVIFRKGKKVTLSAEWAK